MKQPVQQCKCWILPEAEPGQPIEQRHVFYNETECSWYMSPAPLGLSDEQILLANFDHAFAFLHGSEDAKDIPIAMISCEWAMQSGLFSSKHEAELQKFIKKLNRSFL